MKSVNVLRAGICIGDLDTAESKAYLAEQMERLKSQADKEASWTMQVIGLYM